MELSIWLLSSLLVLLIVCMAGLAVRLMKLLMTSQQYLSLMARTSLEVEKEQTSRLHEHLALVEKAMALVGTADPLAYQQVQAMGTLSAYDADVPYDPSDDGELDRIAARSPNLSREEDVNGFESAFVTDLADAGLDGAFFDIPDPDHSARA